MQTVAAETHSGPKRRRPPRESLALTPLEFRLLNEFQKGLPEGPTPFAAMAAQLGASEETVLATLRSLKERGAISRVGPVFRPARLGASTLAALAVPAERLEAVAALVSGFDEVNHNYQREHRLNLWFVVTARNGDRLAEVLAEIEQRTGLPVLNLPMVRDYHLDLGFSLWC